MNSISRFSFPTQIHFGPGVSVSAGPYLLSQARRRPLVVTDRTIASLPITRKLQLQLERAGLHPAVFSEFSGNPVQMQVNTGVAAYREHDADSIIGFGGGAALDVAKAIGLLVNHPGDLFDYEDGRPGALPIDQKIPFWIAIPTTAGTGSEVGRSTVISDDQSHIKKVIFSPRLLAQAVFADPELTLDLPPKITAATGMDALTHCVEAYLAKDFHPICDGIALEGIRLIAQSLPACVNEPRGDAILSARGSMLMGSMMGAIAFQKGLGVTHSCAHALSALTDLHHGLANGVMVDHALRFNLSARPERFTAMAVAVGRDPEPESFLNWLTELKAEIGIPRALGQTGVQEEQLTALSELAYEDSCHSCNPRECSRKDFLGIFQEAL